jgi:hypothetical protein
MRQRDVVFEQPGLVEAAIALEIECAADRLVDDLARVAAQELAQCVPADVIGRAQAHLLLKLYHLITHLVPSFQTLR